jgi:hypothetical protein
MMLFKPSQIWLVVEKYTVDYGLLLLSIGFDFMLLQLQLF